jgi:hypothetical protein
VTFNRAKVFNFFIDFFMCCTNLNVMQGTFMAGCKS